MTAHVIRMRYTVHGVEQFAGTVPVTLPVGTSLHQLTSDLNYMCRTATTGGRALSLVIEDAPPPAPEPASEEVDRTIPTTKAVGKPANGKPAKPPKKKAEPKAKTQKKLDQAAAADKAQATKATNKKAKSKKADKQQDLGLDD